MNGTYLAYCEADAVLAECRKRGIGFTLIENNLGFNLTFPEGAIDDDLLDRIERSWSKISERLRSPFKDTICERCGSMEYIETPIHEGKSIRRDCAKCDRFMGFPVWKGIRKRTNNDKKEPQTNLTASPAYLDAPWKGFLFPVGLSNRREGA